MHYSRLAIAALPLLWTAVSADGTNPNLKYDANAQPDQKYPFSSSKYGKSIIHNHCGSTFYLWNQGADFQIEPFKVQPGDNAWSFPLYQAGKTSDPIAGPSLKIAPANADGTAPNLFALPAPNIGQFEYTVDSLGRPGRTSFDFSYVGNPGSAPFLAGGFQVVGSSDPSSIKQCKPNDKSCTQVYNQWNDDKTFDGAGPMTETAMGNNIELTLCSGAPGTQIGGLAATYNGGSGSSGSGSGSSQQAPSSSAPAAAASSSAPANIPVVQQPENKVAKADPSPSPTPTPTPTPASPKANDVVTIYETETAPVAVVTVYKQNPKEKREEHLHQHIHAHAHQKIHKRRLAL